MEFHGIDMVGPLNTDNIRAQDGTLAATIDDTTGKVNFQDDVDIADALDVQGSARVFQNLEVQGPLASFLQNMSVGGSAAITGSLTVGVDADVGNDLDVVRDLDVGRNADVIGNLTVGDTVRTVNLRMTGGSPAAGLQVQAADALGNLEFGGLPSVPTGESILFYTNDQVAGYTLETLIADDDVVYITKGTGAGGQAGGQAKPGSNWSHLHGVGSITIPAHNHKWFNFVSKGSNYSWASDGTTQLNIRSAYGITGHTTAGLFAQATSCNANNPAGDFWTQDAAAASASGNTDANTTWRPKGHNFTLQTKN